MFNRTGYHNTRPDGFGVLEVVDDESQGVLQAGVPAPYYVQPPRLFVPLKRTELTGEVAGPLASLRLIQTYGYSAEQCARPLEVVYRFPLPGDAAVMGVDVRFGEVEIRAELKERERAEAEYQAAKQEGRQAALATRESPDVFTLHVTGIRPDEDVTVATSYVQLARPEGQGWSLRIPLTTVPRYVRSDEQTSRQAQGQPLLVLRDPGHRFALNLMMRGVAAVESPTHPLTTVPEGDRLRVQLRDREVLPDRDCVLSWRPPQKERLPALNVLLHEDKESGQVYFLAQLAPPSVPAAGEGVAREAILLVDQSGSMMGPKAGAATWAVKQFLSTLKERDSFALGLFDTSTDWFPRNPQRAHGKTVAEAVRFLEASRKSGGTELGVALEQALHLDRTRGEAARHVLIVTDAAVTDSGRILRLADDEFRRADRRRLSVLCIDDSPNAFLATELAERGGGSAYFLTSNSEEDDITTALEEVLADWESPLFAGLRLEVDRPDLQTAGREVLRSHERGWSAVDVGDLPAGRAVWVAGRVPRGESGRFRFRIVNKDGREAAGFAMDLADMAVPLPSLKALFGSRRIAGLEFLMTAGYADAERDEQLKRLGYDPKRDLTTSSKGSARLYAENTRDETVNTLRDLLVREALDYGLASSETAFIAQRLERGEPVAATVPVANALAAGWSNQFVTGMAQMVSAPMAMAAPTGAYYPTQPMPPSPPSPKGGANFYRSGGGANFTAPTSSPPPSPASGPQYTEAPGTPSQAAAGRPAPKRSLAETVRGALGGKPASKTPTPPSDAPVVDARGGAHDAVFAGTPVFTGNEAVLFDTDRAEDAANLPADATLSRLEVVIPGGAPNADALDADLSLLLYVDDMAAPRARVRLADLIRQNGARPLNLRRSAGRRVRIVLADPRGAWAQSAPQIEVRLIW